MPDELIRAFIAVEIPDDVKDEIGRLVAHFERGDTMRHHVPTHCVRWVGRANQHLTLVFLGENPPEFIDRVKGRLAAVAERSARFDFSLSGLGVFPDAHSPRVVWIGGDQGKDRIVALAHDVIRELVTVGFVPERRPFSPHLTIGRVKAPIADVSPIIERKFVSRPFTVERIVLVQSALRPTGPIYSILAEFPLRG